MRHDRRVGSGGPFRRFAADRAGPAARDSGHTGIYGLGEWRELIDEATGEAYQISSPGWAGAYPWINIRLLFIAETKEQCNKKGGSHYDPKQQFMEKNLFYTSCRTSNILY